MMKQFIRLTTAVPFPQGGSGCYLPKIKTYVVRDVEALRKYLIANNIEHKIEILDAYNRPL